MADVDVPAERALTAAHIHALQRLLADATGDARAPLERALNALVDAGR